MAALKTLASSVRSVIIAVAVFLAASIIFSVAASIIAGVAAVFGMSLPTGLLVVVGPVAGLIAVGYAIQEGWTD